MLPSLDFTQAVSHGETPPSRHVHVERHDHSRTWSALGRDVGPTEAGFPRPLDGGNLPRVLYLAACVTFRLELGGVLAAEGTSSTFGDRSASSDDCEEARWEQENRRRIFLIKKERAHGLAQGEAEELERLQQRAYRYLDTVAPLPFDALERMEAGARRILALEDRTT